MSEPRFREWILETIDSLRSRKARPDLERICRMVRRRHGTEPERTCAELEKLIQEHAVLKVNYKGSISYRNAAKVLRGRRKTEQAAAAKSAAVTVTVKRAAAPDLNNGDSALGATDDDQMEDMEDELSTTAGLDSSMDEEDASLDAPSVQNTTDSGIGMCPASDGGSSPPALASPPSTPKSSITRGTAEPTCDNNDDNARSSPVPAQPVAQQNTGSLEPELAQRQPAAICPSAQRSPPPAQRSPEEEGPGAGESALTPDQLMSDCRASPDKAEVGSDSVPTQVSIPMEEGKKYNKSDDDVACAPEIETAKNRGMKRGGFVKVEEMGHDPLQWSVADVVSYFTAVGFPEQAMAFRTQEIDGKSLLLMQRSDVLTGLSIRLGPALKIYEHHVKVLQRGHFQDEGDICS